MSRLTRSAPRFSLLHRLPHQRARARILWRRWADRCRRATLLASSASSLLALTGALATEATAATGTAQAATADATFERARSVAALPYVAPSRALPPDLAALDYDQHRDIRFRPERALWRKEGLPFEVMFFHPGGLFTEPVRVHEVTALGIREIGLDPGDFHYGKNALDPARWPKLRFAGFRVHTALSTPAYKDELIVFLGASYFRAVGRGQRYGLSARALAIDTVGRENRPAPREEFPRFTEFWLERPAPGASAVTIHALLDSPRAVGAFTFVVTPGVSTIAEVRSRILLRAGAEPMTTLGIAPLTSMFLHAENQPNPGDFRPEVHDSDGLQLVTGSGE